MMSNHRIVIKSHARLLGKSLLTNAVRPDYLINVICISDSHEQETLYKVHERLLKAFSPVLREKIDQVVEKARIEYLVDGLASVVVPVGISFAVMKQLLDLFANGEVFVSSEELPMCRNAIQKLDVPASIISDQSAKQSFPLPAVQTESKRSRIENTPRAIPTRSSSLGRPPVLTPIQRSQTPPDEKPAIEMPKLTRITTHFRVNEIDEAANGHSELSSEATLHCQVNGCDFNCADQHALKDHYVTKHQIMLYKNNGKPKGVRH